MGIVPLVWRMVLMATVAGSQGGPCFECCAEGSSDLYWNLPIALGSDSHHYYLRSRGAEKTETAEVTPTVSPTAEATPTVSPTPVATSISPPSTLTPQSLELLSAFHELLKFKD